MNLKLVRRISLFAAAGLAASALTAAAATAPAATASPATADRAGIALVSAPTTTPIKHVVVIIGENHTFDNVFATYQPPKTQHIDNLLSEGIVTASGGLGPHAKQAEQLKASVTRDVHAEPDDHGRLHHPAAAQYDLRRHGM